MTRRRSEGATHSSSNLINQQIFFIFFLIAQFEMYTLKEENIIIQMYVKYSMKCKNNSISIGDNR